MKDDGAFHLIDACDGIAFLVFLGIATTDQHDANCRTGIKLDMALIQITSGYTFKQIDDITLQAQHDTLCLRIAHTTVVLDDVWLGLSCRGVGAIDKSEEDKTFIVDIVSGQSFYGRTNDAVFHLLHPFFRGKGNRGDRTHTARVQACVVFTNALIVLRFGQNLIVLTVGQDEDTALDTTHELLDNHTAGGIAEHTAQHLLQFLLGFVEGGEN